MKAILPETVKTDAAGLFDRHLEALRNEVAALAIHVHNSKPSISAVLYEQWLLMVGQMAESMADVTCVLPHCPHVGTRQTTLGVVCRQHDPDVRRCKGCLQDFRREQLDLNDYCDACMDADGDFPTRATDLAAVRR